MDKFTFCEICGKPKQYPNKPLCYTCWKNSRHCKNCGKSIIELPENYKYYKDCETKLFFNK